ncbi:PREDICTED: uncharacterized protein LOC109227613 [Nicotiana attenuata]|uniref:uncharacterized protein LOC109227613 n=1 Tax=Nicotiana attenuata TaxID=49451 RepID=UPI000905AF4F|nr:PREDICTED: uncharacterized protein LOC109227613 [Nicotiana attenuata]
MEDKERVMQQGPYTANNRPMILKDWDPTFQIKEESMRIVPLWVNFPRLSIQCWIEENLGRIASLLGKPICTDRLTADCERVPYARVLIDMDITQPLPKEVHIEIPGQKSWIQMVEFEWKPKFCLECNNFGHEKGKCQQMEEQKEEVKQKRRRKKRKMIWKPKEVKEQQTDNTAQEEKQELDKGKQKMNTQNLKHKEINYEELANRYRFAPLMIKEKPPEQTVHADTRNEAGQRSLNSTPNAQPP